MADIKSSFTRLKEKIGGFSIAIIFVLIILLCYCSISTRWIQPTKKINTTDANNQTIELDGIYSYVHKEYIIKSNNFEATNTQIPKSSFELEMAILIIFLIVALQIINIKRGRDTKEPLEYPIIRKKAEEHLKSMKEYGIIQDFDLPEGALVQEKQVDDGKKVADNWLIPAEVKTHEGGYEYRVLGFNPFTASLKIDAKTKKEFSAEDRCPECGKWFSMKIISPEGYKQWYDTFELPRRKT